MASSLKSQLLIWLLTPLLIIVPMVAILQFWFTLSPADREFDQQLGDIAIAASHLLSMDGDQVRFEMTPQTELSLRTDQFDKVFIAVMRPDGVVIGGDASLNTPEGGIAAGEWKYVDRQIAGRLLRMVIYGVDCGRSVCQVRVAETMVKRNIVRSEAISVTVLSIIVLGLSSVVTMFLAVRRALYPLQDLRMQLADRSLNDLRALDAPKAPTEVQPLLTAINNLFKRLRDANTSQKSFLADAAHQLRTPLAALQTESELALLEPHPESLHATLVRLNRSASRAARLANQLLSLARVGHDAQLTREFSLLDLKDVGTEMAEEWSPRAFAADIDLGFQLESAPVLGQRLLLMELLSNLIHNSIEYAGRGAHVTVRTYTKANLSIVEVEDDGPGIPVEEQQRVLQRFVRGRDAAGLGSGLGLAIVDGVTQMHGGTVTLGTLSDGTGLLVRVSFPAEVTVADIVVVVEHAFSTSGKRA